MPTYNDEIIGLQQQRDTARRIREGIKPRQGQMVSGVYVPPSATQLLADALKQGISGYQEGQANQAIKAKQEEKQNALAQLLNPVGEGITFDREVLDPTDPTTARNIPLAQQQTFNKPNYDQKALQALQYGENGMANMFANRANQQRQLEMKRMDKDNVVVKPQLVTTYDPTLGRNIQKYVTPEAGKVIGQPARDKAPTGFTYGEGGKLEAIPEYWKQKKEVATAGKDLTNINLPKDEAEFQKKFGKNKADMLQESYESISDARKTLPTIKSLEKIVNDPNNPMFTGAFANFKLEGSKALASLTGLKEGALIDAINNTEFFKSGSGILVGNIIKLFGAGTGLSDADREYAQKIVGGDITLNRESIKRILDINKKNYKRSIKNYNYMINDFGVNTPLIEDELDIQTGSADTPTPENRPTQRVRRYNPQTGKIE